MTPRATSRFSRCSWGWTTCPLLRDGSGSLGPRTSSSSSRSRALPTTSPSRPTVSFPRRAEWTGPLLGCKQVKVTWRADVTIHERRALEAQLLPRMSYRQRVEEAYRPEEVMDTVHDHIWDDVNRHLGTSAASLSQLVEQLGTMRFGHRPRMADTFCGSGQIP